MKSLAFSVSPGVLLCGDAKLNLGTGVVKSFSILTAKAILVLCVNA
jgi:hypothetical protein